MKKTIAIFAAAIFVLIGSSRVTACPDSLKTTFIIPQQIGWITDYERDFDSSVTDQLLTLIRNHEKKTSDQICILTVSSLPEDFSGYAEAVGNSWGIGTKEKNNGVLILLSKTKRLVRISTGLGLESILTDAVAHKVVYETMIPKFRTGDYGAGMIAGVKEIISLLEAK